MSVPFVVAAAPSLASASPASSASAAGGPCSSAGREEHPLLSGAHRVLRALGPVEGAFPGELVTRGDGVAVRADAASLAGWEGWRFAGADHVAAPVDVARRSDGHDALLPWCPDRVVEFLARRYGGGYPLGSGEAVTLVVSLLRGIAELREEREGARTGEWWLADDGRPVFVISEGVGAREGCVRVLEMVGEGAADRVLAREVGAVRDGIEKSLSHPHVPAALLARWERELLSVAAPQPLDRQTFPPERARDVARVAAVRPVVAAPPTRRSRRERASPGSSRPHAGGRWTAIRAAAVEWGGARLPTTLDQLRSRRWRRTPVAKEVHGAHAARVRRRPRSRRRATIVAVAAGAVVLIGGLLWPADAEDAASAGSGQSTQVADSAPDAGADDAAAEAATDGGQSADRRAGAEAEATPSPSPPGGRGEKARADGPVDALAGLLRRIATCRDAGDTACAQAVAPEGDRILEALGAVGDDPPTTELVEEYGDVAVVRVTTGSGGGTNPSPSPAVMTVLARYDGKWLVRDVYDVTDQP